MQLDHIQLAMPKGKETEARAFFVDLLGMVEETKPSPLAERGGCWFRKGEGNIHLGVEDDFRPQKKAHPAFTVEDLNELAEKLDERSHPVIWDSALSDRKRFYTEDPFGNRLEFMQNGDGFHQR